MIDGKHFLISRKKKDFKSYNKIQKTETGRGYDYINGCLLDYFYFKNYFKVITINLTKQQASYGDPKAIQQIRFTGNLN